MRDNYNRHIEYVRISVTDRCNLRCVYCMPEEGIPSISHDKILTYDEISHFCHIMAGLGVKKVKLTGGEPLVRKNLADLVQELKKIAGIEEVTLTTNGVLLEQQMDGLVAAGLDAVNISLDTLDAKHFTKITRCGNIEAVRRGISKVLEYPQVVLKINCVPNYITDREVLEIVKLAQKTRIHVRFIELMPIGMGKDLVNDAQHVDDQETRVREILEREYGRISVYQSPLGNGPSHYCSIEGFQGKIGFISAMSHKFCERCNRVRLTSEGYLKTCLQYEDGIDLCALLREGASDEVIEARIVEAIKNKPISHEFHKKNEKALEVRNMSQIGG